MTQQPSTRDRIIATVIQVETATGEIQAAQAALEIIQANLDNQRDRLRDVCAELRNITQSMTGQGD